MLTRNLKTDVFLCVMHIEIMIEKRGYKIPRGAWTMTPIIDSWLYSTSKNIKEGEEHGKIFI